MTLNAEVRARLDAHLDAVEKALVGANCTRERRRGVVDDLEAQILDMLAGKSEAPTVAELEEVLGKLDPPSAYGEGAGRASAAMPSQPAAPAIRPQPRYARTAIWGLVCILISLLPLPALAVKAIFVQTAHITHVQGGGEASVESPGNTPRASSVYSWRGIGLGLCVLVVAGPLALLGTILGWIAFAQIRGSGGMLRGTGLALFDALFYPIMFVLLIGTSAWA